jgi:hypothetical protein
MQTKNGKETLIFIQLFSIQKGLMFLCYFTLEKERRVGAFFPVLS